jgi:hypothetical protein
MSKKGVEQLIGKALADQKFLEDFLKDPEGKIKESGFDVSPEELARIKQVNAFKAKKFAESFAEEFGTRRQAL